MRVRTTHLGRPKDDQMVSQLLLKAGSTNVSQLSGRLGTVVSLFGLDPRGDMGPLPQKLHRPRDSLEEPIFNSLPLPHLTALSFAFNSLSAPVWLPREPIDLPTAFSPNSSSFGLGNIYSGAFALPSVYGQPMVSGDVAATLRLCLVSPWDPAKIWLDRSRENAPSDILRLHNVIARGGAVLQESWFTNLPELHRKLYFEDDELSLRRAIIPDLRNDQSLPLSQFHSTILRCHNATVEHYRRQRLRSLDRLDLFNLARKYVTELFAYALLQDALPRILDPAVLDWSVIHGAPFYRRAAQVVGSRNVLPIEACLILPGLLALHQPAAFHPNQTCSTPLRSEQWVSQAPFVGLPAELFVSRRIPTRLRAANLVDWLFLCDEPGPSGDRTAGRRCASSRSCPDLDTALGALSGQACADAVKRASGLEFPIISEPDDTHLSGGVAGATPLLPYVITEAKQIGKRGRLGPLGSLIVAETFVGAILTTIPEIANLTQKVTLRDLLMLPHHARPGPR